MDVNGQRREEEEKRKLGPPSSSSGTKPAGFLTGLFCIRHKRRACCRNDEV